MEWTDYIVPRTEIDTGKKASKDDPPIYLKYRTEETNDCEIIQEATYGTDRPDFGDNAVPGI